MALSTKTDMLLHQPKLTKGQRNVYETLRSLPAAYRHQGMAGAPIKMWVMKAYDRRCLNALTDMGMLIWTEHGVVVD
jgi:hypothetical protein